MRFDAIAIEVDGIEAFFSTAPFVVRIEQYFAASPDDVWDVLSGNRMWSWLPTVWGCRYPSGTDPAAGVVRDFQMYLHTWRFFAQHERMLVVNERRALCYTAIDATLPVFGSWCEEYRVDGSGDGAVVSWTMAVAPRFLSNLPGAKRVLGLASAILRPILAFGLRGLVRELPAHAPPKPPAAQIHPVQSES